MWRPDIRYAVQRLCIKASKPAEQDQQAARRIISYLLGTARQGVTLNYWNNTVDVFTDAGEEVLEDKATSGILVMSGSSPISWTSRKQDVITLSSTEAEYIALCRIRGTRCHVVKEDTRLPRSACHSASLGGQQGSIDTILQS